MRGLRSRRALSEERIPSREQTRPQLETALGCCREDNELVVWRLDRLDKSVDKLNYRDCR
jgi:DNA invertase Pin-like site-specific DNA recombinase